MGMNAVAYVRVSTDEQAEEGVSVDAQVDAVKAYAVMRGLHLVDVIVDAGVSAGEALSTRAGGARLLDLVRRRKVRAVVAAKLDRLFRNAGDCLAVTEAWTGGEVALHLVDMGGQAVDTSSAMGRFFLTVMAGAAEMERNLIRERTRSALAHKRSQGRRTSRDAPVGWRVSDDGDTLVADAAEQRAVALVRELRASGLTIRAIAERMNQAGVPARGTRWHKTTVERVLSASLIVEKASVATTG